MIIDTKGFEIGDEVWVVDIMFGLFYETSITIDTFRVDKYGICITDIFDERSYHLECLFHTKEECKLHCDKLNGVKND